MTQWFGKLFAGLALAVGVAVCPVRAQAADHGKSGVQDAKRAVEGFWEPSAILKMAVKNLARRYNLNEEQTAITDRMMTERVNRFIEQHQAKVWPLLRDLAIHQRDGSAPDPERARAIGPVALEIVREAKEEIFKSNEEWREILTDEQKKLHDWDLREMRKTFDRMEDNFQSWAEGKPRSGAIFPQASTRRSEPPQPPRPASRGTLHLKPEENPELDVQFDVYVQKFIRDYGLRADQIETANSILREIKQRAGAFRDSNARAIQDIKNKITGATSVEERKAWDRKRKTLMHPIGVLFAELKERLDHVPDKAQRDRFQLRAERGASRNSAISSSKVKRPRPTPARLPIRSENKPKKPKT